MARRFFTPDQANAMLPLVSRIVQDIADLARDLRDKHQRFRRLTEDGPLTKGGSLTAELEWQRETGQEELDQLEEVLQLESQLETGREQMEHLEKELGQLGILLKDYFIGLIDFPCWRDGREIYLCWKLGEPEVGHWHEIDVGFSGRQKLMIEARTK